MAKIRGTKKEEAEIVPEPIGSKLMASSLMATGFGQGG